MEIRELYQKIKNIDENWEMFYTEGQDFSQNPVVKNLDIEVSDHAHNFVVEAAVKSGFEGLILDGPSIYDTKRIHGIHNIEKRIDELPKDDKRRELYEVLCDFLRDFVNKEKVIEIREFYQKIKNIDENWEMFYTEDQDFSDKPISKQFVISVHDHEFVVEAAVNSGFEGLVQDGPFIYDTKRIYGIQNIEKRIDELPEDDKRRKLYQVLCDFLNDFVNNDGFRK